MTPRSITLPTIPTIAAFILAAVVLAAGVRVAMRPRPMTGTTAMAVTDLGRRVLVVATHPDDEVLTAGGAVSELLARGASVRVVIATAGDGYFRAAARTGRGFPGASAYLRLGDIRHQESLASARVLGLPEADVISLGYPDAGTTAMWDGGWDHAHPVAGRSGRTDVPYAWAYRPGADSCGQDLAADLAAIVSDFQPDTVIAPDPRETHPDHAAVGAFTLYALDEAGFTGTRLTAIVHFKRFPYPWAYMPEAGLAPPPQLLGAGAEWLALPLTANAEQTKHRAFEEYRSQTAIADLSWYMRAFVRRNELFCRRPASVPSMAATDARPATGSAGTVAVLPRPVIAPRVLDPVRVASVRLVRGPQVLWIGIVTGGPVRADAAYRVGLRLIGGTSAPQRLDLEVRGGRVEALRPADDSLVPEGLQTAADGSTVWIGVPAALLSGRTSAMVSGSSSLAGRGGSHTPWVDVRL